MVGATPMQVAPVMTLLGPSGAGESTQARILEEVFDLVQLSIGDLLPAAVTAGTAAGKEADTVMKAGGLVSDETVLEILSDRLRSADCNSGVMLDGFPHTVCQAEALDHLFAANGQSVSAATSLEVGDQKMVARITGRFTCDACGEGYHETFKAPKVVGTCDACAAQDMTRPADDNAPTVMFRLERNHSQTAPLLQFYSKQGVLKNVDAMGDIDAIAQDLARIAGRFGG